MKIVLAASLCIVTVFCPFVVYADGGPLDFDTRSLLVELKKPDVVNYYMGCVLNRGNCSAIGRQLRQYIPELVSGSCGGCNSVEHKNYRLVIAFLQRRYPRCWRHIVSHFLYEKTVPQSYNGCA